MRVASINQAMYGGEFLFTVSRAWVSRWHTPLVVVLGNDLHHPAATSRELAALAPNARRIEHWQAPEPQPAAMKAIARLLAAHTPR